MHNHIDVIISLTKLFQQNNTKYSDKFKFQTLAQKNMLNFIHIIISFHQIILTKQHNIFKYIQISNTHTKKYPHKKTYTITSIS